MDLEKEFREETGQNSYIANDLRSSIPLGYYVEWLEERIKQLTLTSVSNRRELLIAFMEYVQKHQAIYFIDKEDLADGIIKSN